MRLGTTTELAQGIREMQELSARNAGKQFQCNLVGLGYCDGGKCGHSVPHEYLTAGPYDICNGRRAQCRPAQRARKDGIERECIVVAHDDAAREAGE